MIRKTLAFILLSALVFLSAQGIFSCRSLKKNGARADSTVTRSEHTNLAWQSETITEISLGPGELLPYIQGDSLAQFPDVFMPPVKQPKGLFARIGLSGRSSQLVKKREYAGTAALISAPARLILKKIQRQSGHVEQKKEEEKQVQIQVKNTYKEPNATGLLAVGFGAFVLLIILCVWVKLKIE